MIDAQIARLAAAPGRDTKRIVARRALATEFFNEHIYLPSGDWELVRRAMQCIDFDQPVIAGPAPPTPTRLVGLDHALIGVGFFTEQPAPGSKRVVWWNIKAEAPYLRFFAPFAADVTDGTLGAAGDVRYFVPAARNGLSVLARPAGA